MVQERNSFITRNERSEHEPLIKNDPWLILVVA